MMNEKKKIVFWNVSGPIFPTLDGQTTKRQRTLREETKNTLRDIARVRLLIPHYHKKRSSSLYCVTTVVIGAETSIHQEPTHLMAQRNK